MLELPDFPHLLMMLAGALVAGFTTGFAGFGTGLVASGLWFHALPAALVPPLVVLASVAAQLMSLFFMRRAFNWRRVSPFLAGGVFGVPLGVTALSLASPGLVRTSVGIFLIAYGVYQLMGLGKRTRLTQHRTVDAAVGTVGGFLGGFAGLSGPVPLIWLQLQGGPVEMQRAVYQPFNLLILTLSGATMLLAGRINAQVLSIALLCLPLTLLGAGIGVRVYRAFSETVFKKAVLILLLVSGGIIVVQAIQKTS